MIKRANPTVVYHGVNIGSGSYPCNVYMELDANGEFVLYEDHLAECDGYMSELADYERTVIRLRKELAEKDKEIERLKIDAERYRRVRRLSVNEFNNIFARNISGHQSFDSCIDEIENFVLDETVIDDGFGNSWSKTCPMCHMQTMQIVRPGKVQCSICG